MRLYPLKTLRCGSARYGLKTSGDIQKLSSYEIFISLYHQFKSGKTDNEEEEVVFDENSKNYNRNLLRVDRLLNALKIRLFKVVKCDKKQENVGNSYFIPALFIYHTPTLCIHIN